MPLSIVSQIATLTNFYSYAVLSCKMFYTLYHHALIHYVAHYVVCHHAEQMTLSMEGQNESFWTMSLY